MQNFNDIEQTQTHPEALKHDAPAQAASIMDSDEECLDLSDFWYEMTESHKARTSDGQLEFFSNFWATTLKQYMCRRYLIRPKTLKNQTAVEWVEKKCRELGILDTDRPDLDLDNPVRPLIGKSRWLSISDDIYEKITPALRLVSLWLTDERMEGLFDHCFLGDIVRHENGQYYFQKSPREHYKELCRKYMMQPFDSLAKVVTSRFVEHEHHDRWLGSCMNDDSCIGPWLEQQEHGVKSFETFWAFHPAPLKDLLQAVIVAAGPQEKESRTTEYRAKCAADGWDENKPFILGVLESLRRRRLTIAFNHCYKKAAESLERRTSPIPWDVNGLFHTASTMGHELAHAMFRILSLGNELDEAIGWGEVHYSLKDLELREDVELGYSWQEYIFTHEMRPLNNDRDSQVTLMRKWLQKSVGLS